MVNTASLPSRQLTSERFNRWVERVWQAHRISQIGA
jgi:hypothetical protein